jgi:hypothetical protein
MFGGFDQLRRGVLPHDVAIARSGYQVIGFDGPRPGWSPGGLRPGAHREWHRPVGGCPRPLRPRWCDHRRHLARRRPRDPRRGPMSRGSLASSPTTSSPTSWPATCGNFRRMCRKACRMQCAASLSICSRGVQPRPAVHGCCHAGLSCRRHGPYFERTGTRPAVALLMTCWRNSSAAGSRRRSADHLRQISRAAPVSRILE